MSNKWDHLQPILLEALKILCEDKKYSKFMNKKMNVTILAKVIQKDQNHFFRV